MVRGDETRRAVVETPRSEQALEEVLAAPRDATRAALARVPGSLMVLGAGGKMGPTLVRMIRHTGRDVVAVSRFTTDGVRSALDTVGAETICCDLLDREQVARLPDATNIVYLAGRKFGTSGAPWETWRANVVAPAICVERFAGTRFVALSTGNVYPLVPVGGPWARETDPVAPVGEYAASCVGRERVFEHAAMERDSPTVIVRLNYANDLRYGVLTDLARHVTAGTPIALNMGAVNVIWQGDACRAVLELLPLAAMPPLIVNITGPAVLSVRALATALGERLERTPRFTGEESPDALLSDTTRMRDLLKPPDMPLETLLDWVAAWVASGGPVRDQSTHFQTRDGTF